MLATTTTVFFKAQSDWIWATLIFWPFWGLAHAGHLKEEAPGICALSLWMPVFSVAPQAWEIFEVVWKPNVLCINAHKIGHRDLMKPRYSKVLVQMLRNSCTQKRNDCFNKGCCFFHSTLSHSNSTNSGCFSELENVEYGQAAEVHDEHWSSLSNFNGQERVSWAYMWLENEHNNFPYLIVIYTTCEIMLPVWPLCCRVGGFFSRCDDWISL